MTFARLGARSRPSIALEGVDRAVELTSWRLASDDGDQDFASTIAEQNYYLEGEAYQSTASGSLWRFARMNSGATVAYELRPHGNEIPTLEQPHYVGQLIVGPKPELGGGAVDRWFTFAFVWRVLGEPQQVPADAMELLEVTDD